ncbi:MAG: Ig-like domain-containing protein, partial [Pseudomonadota bacterium]
MNRASTSLGRVAWLLCAVVMAGCAGGSAPAGQGEDSLDAPADVIAAETGAGDVAPDLEVAAPDRTAGAVPEAVGDTTAPAVEFVQPLDGAEVEGVVAIVVDATDDTGVMSVELFADGVSLGVLVECPFAFTWDATDLWSGSYTLRAAAEDQAGNVGEAEISVTVLGVCDENGDCPPTVDIGAPEAGAVVRGMVEVKATAGDDDAVVKVRFLVDGGLLLEDGQVPYKADWDTTEFDDGPHTLEVTAWDTTDKTAGAQIEVVVDNTPPEITFLTPEEGVIQHDEILLSADATDNLTMDRVEFSVDGEAPGPVPEAPWDLVYDGSALVAGIHVVEATAFDAAGNETSVTREILVDRPPVVVILTPTAGLTVTGPFTVQAEAGDDVGLEDVVLYMDGAWMAKLDPVGEGLYEDTWFPPYEKTERVLSVVATDSVGQETTAETTVLVDHPVTAALLLCVDEICQALEADTELTGTVQIRAVAEDDGAEIIGMDFLVDDALSLQDTEAPFDFAWDTTTVEDGARLLAAVAVNALDETAAVQVPILVNNCDLDHDGFVATGCGGPDCDDGAAGINPDAADLVGDAADQNCDGMDGTDADGDGHASEVSGGEDCDDGAPLVHPCGDDLPGDDIDGNCDGVDALSCDDCEPCVTDVFDGGICVHTPIGDGGVCDDGDLCTGDGTCQDLVCLPGGALDCDDQNVCTADGCVSDMGCYHLPLDGLPCNGGICLSGSCCLPDCGGKACGPDGCGGSCGTCGAGLVCDQGVCVDPCTPDCAGKECGDDGCGGTCPCGAGFVCDGTTCVFDPGSGPGYGPGPNCAALLPPLLCGGGQANCSELVQFDPAEEYGYVDQLVLDETWDDQYRSWLSRHAAMAVRYATAYVACKAADWEIGNGGPLGLLDMSEADGAIPGTSIGQPAHPQGTHTLGHDIDVAYYQAGTPDNLARIVCKHDVDGVDAYHCTATPHLLDPWRTALFIGALHEHPDLRVVGCDGKAGPALYEALAILCSEGWLSNEACNNISLAYETVDQGYGWYDFHHGNMHVSFFAPSCTPSCAGKVCGANGCGGFCGVCPFGESCSEAGSCEAGCVVSSKLTQFVPGVGGHPGEALDVDAEPATCAPVNDCEQGLDNEASTFLAALVDFFPGALEGGDAMILLSASGPLQAEVPFTLGLFAVDLVAPLDCDVQTQTCDYAPIAGGPPAQFDNAQIDAQGLLTAGGPAYDVMVPCRAAPWACIGFWTQGEVTGAYTQAYNVQIEAATEGDGCGPLTLTEGVIGGAISKAAMIEALDAVPADQLPLDKDMILGMLNMLLVADIDVDGDGDMEGVSVGMKIAGIPANLLPAAPDSDLVITEIMYDPSDGVPDDKGEWIEIYNAASDDIDINGYRLADAGGNLHIIQYGGPLIVGAG